VKIINKNKTKKQKIFEVLDKQGYILDEQTVDIFGDESGVWKVWEYVRMWKRLNQDKNFFKAFVVIEKSRGHRSHLVRVQGQESWYKVGKEFYETITL